MNGDVVVNGGVNDANVLGMLMVVNDVYNNIRHESRSFFKNDVH